MWTRREIVVREGKGNKDRVTVLPENLILPLKAHLEKVGALHARGLSHRSLPAGISALGVCCFDHGSLSC